MQLRMIALFLLRNPLHFREELNPHQGVSAQEQYIGCVILGGVSAFYKSPKVVVISLYIPCSNFPVEIDSPSRANMLQ